MQEKKTKIIVTTPKKKESVSTSTKQITDSDSVDPPSNINNSNKPKIFRQKLVSKGGPVDPVPYKDNVQGIDIDKNAAKSSPQSHEVKMVKYGSGTSAKTKIIGTDGTVVYDGRNSDKSTKDAIRNTTNKVNDVVERRKYNSDFYNGTDNQEARKARKK